MNLLIAVDLFSLFLSWPLSHFSTYAPWQNGHLRTKTHFCSQQIPCCGPAVDPFFQRFYFVIADISPIIWFCICCMPQLCPYPSSGDFCRLTPATISAIQSKLSAKDARELHLLLYRQVFFCPSVVLVAHSPNTTDHVHNSVVALSCRSLCYPICGICLSASPCSHVLNASMQPIAPNPIWTPGLLLYLTHYSGPVVNDGSSSSFILIPFETPQCQQLAASEMVTAVCITLGTTLHPVDCNWLPLPSHSPLLFRDHKPCFNSPVPDSEPELAGTTLGLGLKSQGFGSMELLFQSHLSIRPSCCKGPPIGSIQQKVPFCGLIEEESYSQYFAFNSLDSWYCPYSVNLKKHICLLSLHL